jgi:CheY-like chemotaxis protein
MVRVPMRSHTPLDQAARTSIALVAPLALCRVLRRQHCPTFTFMHSCGTNRPLRRFGMELLAGWEEVADLPIVLIIEDDESIQSIVEDALKEGGFETAIAPSGEEAVTLLQSGLVTYRALVTDIGLKGRIDGWEVAKKAREKEPTLPVIYMSGAHAQDWASRGVPNSIMLTKPFAPAQLVTAVSQLLNIGSPPTAPT